jgi:hypothetical protein
MLSQLCGAYGAPAAAYFIFSAVDDLLFIEYCRTINEYCNVESNKWDQIVVVLLE